MRLESGRLGRRGGRGGGLTSGDVRIVSGRGLGGGGEEHAGAHMGLQQFLHLGADRCLTPAGVIEVGGALGALGPVEGPQEKCLQVGLRRCHRSSLRGSRDGGSGPAEIPSKRYAPSGAKVRQGLFGERWNSSPRRACRRVGIDEGHRDRSLALR